MCVSLEVSIVALVVSIGTCVYLFRRGRPGDKQLSLTFGFIGLMQLLETLMWLDQKCGELNHCATHVARLQNALQPLVSLLMAFMFARGEAASAKLPLLLIFALYAYASLPCIMKAPIGCSQPCEGSKQGLSWTYTTGSSTTPWTWWVFTLALVAPLYTLPQNRWTFIAVSVGIWLLSILVGKLRCGANGLGAEGSLWCLMGAFVPLLAIFLNRREKYVKA